MSLHLDTTSAVAAVTANPYLEGAYAPVHDELEVDDLPVLEGQIPEDLSGVYVRNGPNPQHEPEGRYHWFDGDGMVHAVQFRDGRASYRNRWVRTGGFEREREAGHALWRGIIEPTAENPSDAREKDTANTDLVFHAGRLLALWYRAGQPYALDPETLESLGTEDFGCTLRSEVSAHAKVDARSGELMFFDYGVKPPYLRYGVVGPDQRIGHFVGIDLPGPRLPHDMAITENYSILMDLPLMNDPEAAHAGRHKLLFDRELPSRFGIIPRHGSSEEVRWFEAAPCYIYHSVNAYEDGDEVVLDVCRVTRPRPITGLEGELAQMLSYLRPETFMHRYRFNLHTGQTVEEQRDDELSEFPSIPQNLTGHRSRYAYNMHINNDETLLFDGLIKYDLESGDAETHWFGDGRWGSEAPFAPRPGAVAEDDGYVVSYVHDEREARSEVVVLDAADVTAPPVCRLGLPRPVPLGFHATWVPGEQLSGARG